MINIDNQNQIAEKIRKAKLKLFTNDLIFFGMNANKFTWGLEDIPEHIEGFVRFNKDDLTQLETGVIHINKNYVEKSNYCFNNLAFIICHELLHILNKHGIRRGDRKWAEWNAACDHVIEKFLKGLSPIIVPYEDRYNIIPELEKQLPNCTAEQAYDWIIKNPDKVQLFNINSFEISVKDGQGNLLFTINGTMGGSSEDSNDQLETMIIDQIVAEATAIFETMKEKGSLSGNLVTYLDKILKVEIPWEKLVEKAIKTNIIMKPDERCWRMLNKYYVPHKITLPGYSTIEEQEGTGILIVGVDSSGSIQDRNLKQFAGILEISMKYFKTIIVIVHDDNIHQIETFDKDNIFKFYEFIKKVGFKGRGGTSHTHLFNKIEVDYWEHNKDDLSMVISLTDMYSNIESIYTGYKWIKNNLPLVFIITSDGKEIESLENSQIGDITQIKINN